MAVGVATIPSLLVVTEKLEASLFCMGLAIFEVLGWMGMTLLVEAGC